MQAKTWGKRMLDRDGILYPMLVIAAVSVIIFSVLGIAMMMGMLPRAESMMVPEEMTQPKARVAGNADKTAAIAASELSEIQASGFGMVGVTQLANRVNYGAYRTGTYPNLNDAQQVKLENAK